MKLNQKKIWFSLVILATILYGEVHPALHFFSEKESENEHFMHLPNSLREREGEREWETETKGAGCVHCVSKTGLRDCNLEVFFFPFLWQKKKNYVTTVAVCGVMFSPSQLRNAVYWCVRTHVRVYSVCLFELTLAMIDQDCQSFHRKCSLRWHTNILCRSPTVSP